MEFIYFFLLYFVFGGSIIYLIFCVNPNGRGPLASIRRVIFVAFPAVYREYAPKIIGNKGVGALDKTFNYLCYKNHPLVQILYIIVVFGTFGLYIKSGFMVLLPSNHLSIIHVYTGTIYVLFCLWTYYKVCTVDPGTLTKDNVDSTIQKYKFDQHVYPENNVCATCKIVKPARSKHCRICNVCVSAFDHHCVWVRQCIGEKNYKYFLLYIFNHCLLCIYGFIAGLKLIYGVVVDEDLLNRKFRMATSGKVIESNWYVVLQYLFIIHSQFLFVIIVCLIMAIALFVFLVIHYRLVASGRTTAENIKIGDALNQKRREYFKKKRELKQPAKKLSAKEELALTDEIEKIEQEIITIRGYGSKGFFKNLKIIFNN